MPVMRSLSAAVIVATLTLEVTLAQAPSISPITTSTPLLTTSASSLDHVVELTGQLDQRLLTTVYWCLGTLVTVFLILIGYNWFVNFRIHERDFRELKNDISTGLDAAVIKVETAAKAAGEEVKTELRKNAESYINSKTAQIAQTIQDLRGQVAELQAESVEREVDKWLAEKVYNNALRYHVRYLRLVRNEDWRVQRGLDRMERILRTMIREQPGRRPNADDIAELSRFLEGAAKQNPVLVKTLQTLVTELCGSKGTD